MSESKGDTPGQNAELARAMSVKTNDQLMSIYLSSLIRAITAFHDLIENKIHNRQLDEEGKKDEDGKEEDKEIDKGKDKEAAKDLPDGEPHEGGNDGKSKPRRNK